MSSVPENNNSRKAMIDKRKHVRIPFSTPMQGHLTFNFEIRDISITGCFVETTAPLAKGTVLGVDFTLPNTARMIRAKGEVRWSGPYTSGNRTEATRGVGIRFVELSPDDIAIIAEFIGKRATRTRKFGRAHLSLPIVYSKEAQPLKFEGVALDIGLGGLFIRTQQLPELGEELRMEFSLHDEGDPIRCSGKVIYVNQDIPDIFKGMIHSGMGIEFTDIKVDDMERIERALENPLGIETSKV